MADTPKRAALYVRASCPGPSTGAQLIELAHIAKSAGWERAAIYRDTGVPAARGRGEHPEFDRMVRDATRRRFDVLLAWSVDRLARTLRELFATLAVLRAAGIDLYLKEQGVDTTAASGRALFETVGIFTELENALTRAVCKPVLTVPGRPENPSAARRSMPSAPMRSAPRWPAGSASAKPPGCITSGSAPCSG
jgi:DNA invertase Pin-like site-specific DNA recombinase